MNKLLARWLGVGLDLRAGAFLILYNTMLQNIQVIRAGFLLMIFEVSIAVYTVCSINCCSRNNDGYSG